MKGFAARFSMLLGSICIFAAVANAGPVYQAAGFNESQFTEPFQVRLDSYGTTGIGPLTGTDGGGAFKAKLLSGSGSYINTIFPTFCLEKNETFTFGTTYYATIDPAAYYGGVDNGGAPAGTDPVSSATQLLYKTFLTGNLTTVVSAFDYDGQRGDYTALQNAIWALENEVTAPTSGLATSLYNWATTAAAAGGNQQYGVMAMNLWTADSPYAKQSQLIWVGTGGTGVPEPSSFVLLLISMGGLTILHQRKELLARIRSSRS